MNHEHPLTALAKPYPTTETAWHIVRFEPETHVATAQFLPTTAAAKNRLNTELGAHEWSFTAQAAAPNEVLAVLRIAGVSRTAFITRGSGETAEAALDRAFLVAFTDFGLPAALANLPAANVEVDDETGEALAFPPPPEQPVVPVSDDSAATPEVTGDPATDELAAGRELIGRLIDRLQKEGQGHEVARLVARSSGYGRDAAEARALYGQLRELLQQARTSE